MKSLLALLFSCLAVCSLHAQSSDTNSTAPSSPNPGTQMEPPPPPPGGLLSNLSKEEKAELKAAHDKAIQQDPSLDQKMKTAHEAMEAARRAMHDAMVKIDPSVAQILEKIAPRKWGRKMEKANCSNSGTSALSTNSASGNGLRQEGRPMPPGFANLTPSEQAQLKAAHEQAKNAPEVLTAREAEKIATTPQDRQAAKEAVHQAMHDAMLKADPSIELLLAKLHPHTQEPPAPPTTHPGQSAPGQGIMTTP